MQIRFFLAGKSNGEQSGSVGAEAATPCLVLVMPRRVRNDGNSKAFGGERPDLGFQGGFPMPVGQDFPKTAKLLVFHRTALNFRELTQKFLPSPLRHSRCLPLPEGHMTAGHVFHPSHGVTKRSVRAQHRSPDPSLPCPAPGRANPGPGTCWGHRWVPDSSGSSLGELRGE